MARAKEFNCEPDPMWVILSKIVDATRNKAKLSDRDRYKEEPAMAPGQHRAQGTLEFDVTYTVGEEAEAARYYGVPIDAVLLYAFLLSGALREHFVRAAKILQEIRLSQLEGKDEEHPRPYKDVSYTFKRKRGSRLVSEQITIPAADVAAAAEVIAGKLIGDESDEDRALTLEQVADCLAKLKTVRKYDGPINLDAVDMSVKLLPNLAVEEAA